MSTVSLYTPLFT
uniref:Uncharacterized protein n=1 Tax=Arundo donax TaxID=35708 RepID=A0A0A8Y112_ARUDO